MSLMMSLITVAKWNIEPEQHRARVGLAGLLREAQERPRLGGSDCYEVEGPNSL